MNSFTIASNWGRSIVNNSFLLQTVRNATKRAGGTIRNGRDSPGQRLGVKKFGGYVFLLVSIFFILNSSPF